MTRCKLCESLSVELLDNNDVAFHNDLSSLQESAQSGCDFCNLCWGRLELDWSRDQLDACLQGKKLSYDSSEPEGPPWVPQMWLRGQFFDRRSHSESRIWLSCGRLDEENVGQGASTSLSLFAAPGKFCQTTGCAFGVFHA